MSIAVAEEVTETVSEEPREAPRRSVSAELKNGSATALLGIFTAIGWIAGALSVTVLTVLRGTGWTVGVVRRALGFCWLALSYGYCKGAGIPSVRKADMQGSPPPGPGIPPNTAPGTFPGTFLQ